MAGIPIDLESGLEISTSDMLVPINQPTFQHNWQKFQGKCLPNSLRFEKNGWACNWNVYNFNYNAYREEVNGKYVGLGQFNTYTELVSLYDKIDDTDSVFDVSIVSDSIVLAGNAQVNGNVVTGTVGGKPYSMTWNADTKSFEDLTAGFFINQVINSDNTITAKITDADSFFDFDFNILTASDLTGDQVVNTKFTYYDPTLNTYSWGGYVYDGVSVFTPEEVQVTPTLSDTNLLSFDYNVVITDETLNLQYSMQDYYTRFNNVVRFKNINKDNTLLMGSELLAFDFYRVSRIGSQSNLLAGDQTGMKYDWQVPLWLEFGMTVRSPDLHAKKCDNIKNYEVGIRLGTGYYNTIHVQNIYTGAVVDINLTGIQGTRFNWLNDLDYRFNKIQPEATIELPNNFQPYKYKLNSQVYYRHSKGFRHIRQPNLITSTRLTRALGDGFSINWYYRPTDDFAINSCWSYDPTSQDPNVLTVENISNVRTIRLNSESNSILLTGDDLDLVDANRSKSDYDIFAGFSGTIINDVSQLTTKTYSELYDSNGKFIGDTYIAVDFENENVPVQYLPVMKINIDGTDTVCYWVNSSLTSYYTTPDAFANYFFGQFAEQEDWQDEVLVERADYSRTRLVKTYKPTFDFNKEGLDESFDELWEKVYSDYNNPHTYFNESDLVSGNRYESFNDIDIQDGQDVEIYYNAPGVYVRDYYAVQFGSPSGLIIYEDPGEMHLESYIKHHGVDVASQYVISTSTEPGRLSGIGISIELPAFFGKSGQEIIYKGSQGLIDWRPWSSTVQRTSAEVNLLVNYREIRHYDPDTGTDVYSYLPDPNAVQASNWLRYARLSLKNGQVQKYELTLNNGVTQVYKAMYEGDLEGLKVAWPVWGHSGFRIKYTGLSTKGDITATDSTIKFEKLEDADLPNQNYIYWDRDSTAKSMHLFDILLKGSNPDDEGMLSMLLSLTSDNNNALYYADDVYNDKGEKTILKYYDTDENLKQMPSLPTLKIEGTPVIKQLPIKANISFSRAHDYAHIFYAQDYSILEKGTLISDPKANYNFANDSLIMVLLINNNAMAITYDAANNITVTDTLNTHVIDNEAEDIVLSQISGESTNAVITMNMALNYNNCEARLPAIVTNTYSLGEVNESKYAVEHDGVTLVYDTVKRTIVGTKCDSFSNENIENGQHITAKGSISDTVTCVMPMVINGELNGDALTFVYNGTIYDINVAELKAHSEENGIDVLSTDIRRPEKTYNIGKLKQNGQYQLLRQRWNTTTEIENYWWIDPTHVLELTKSKFILSRNTKEPDDWNGDRFEKIFEINRSDILTTDMRRYFCTNVYKSDWEALFVTSMEQNGKVLLQFYKPRSKLEKIFEFELQVRQKELGQTLNDVTYSYTTAYLNTYNPLTAAQILSKAEWSSTIVGHNLILGCHFSNNFDQWAVVYDLELNQIKYCIQGYGYVGLHGDLTGGMIPAKYFDVTRGFTDRVQDLSVLGLVKNSDDIDDAAEITDFSKIGYIESKVVGTTEQQWYITQELHGVVSHLLYKNGEFAAQSIPITNNYSAMYRSPSFGALSFGDNLPQFHPLRKLVNLDGDTDGALKAVCEIIFGVMGEPIICALIPRLSMLLYLQQSFGQYAYVHYNSSTSLPEQEPKDEQPKSIGALFEALEGPLNTAMKRSESPVLNDAYTFDKQKVTQNASLDFGVWSFGIMAVLIPAFSAGINELRNHVFVNEENNQTATTDIGRKYSSNVMENTSNLLISQIGNKSKRDMAATSIVTGIKSLDMFYSTADQQRVFAGPGYTEHQYVADCVAQSVTDLSVEGKVQQLFFCIRFVTELQYKLEAYVLELSKQALIDAGYIGQTEDVSAWGFSINIGSIAGVLTAGVAALVNVLLATTKATAEEMDKFLDTLCANGITSSVFSGVPDRKNLSVEGKHKYGEKNETFMWPCWGITPGSLKYTDEKVFASSKVSWWEVKQDPQVYWTDRKVDCVSVKLPKGTDWSFSSSDAKNASNSDVEKSTTNRYMRKLAAKQDGQVPFYQIAPYGDAVLRTLPDDMAKIEGVNRFLPDMAFKNENIGVSDPAFTPSMFQDYVIDKTWDLSQCCTYGMQQWVTVKDTKITNCAPSNMVVNDNFCGVATPYSAIEVKRGISKKYMRPWAITPTVLAFNVTGYNSIFDDKLYHSFDGISYRLVDFIGSPGLGKNRQTFWYAFQKNDRFKRSNKFPANEIQGNFLSEPVQALDTIDETYTIVTVASKEKGLEGGITGEDKDETRWALPMFTEPVSTLPAAVKTLTAMLLTTYEGITGLVTTLENNLTAYKAPLSVDFVIGKQKYRVTEEYICTVQTEDGFDTITDIIPTLGLTFIGSTPAEAFLYSQSTRCYYSFSGEGLTKLDMMERFRNIQRGFWDFVNQEVVMPCLMTYKRLNAEVEDKDTETDNVIVPVLSKGTVSGELPPPITTIFNDRSWYKCVSLPGGFAYQGPNRVIINRAVFVEYMEQSIKDNYNKWSKMDREKYVTHRVYPEVYDNILKDVRGVDGWTYNPFVFVTSPLGNSENTDCIFEWEITFCWPVEMDLLYGVDNYACVNIMSETMTPGGKVFARPTHVFLTKELFTRTGNYGYYSYKYTGKNGAGNRERLHIWSDQYIAVSSIYCEAKQVTQKRTDQLTQQVDVQKLKEL